MDQETFNRYLETRYTPQLNYYKAKAATNKRRYNVLQLLTVGLSAVLPVLITAPLPGEWKLVTTIVSIILAIATALFKVLHLPENWINFRTSVEKLKQEKVHFDFRFGRYEIQEEEQMRRIFIEQVESILGEETGAWSNSLAKSLASSGGDSFSMSEGTQRKDRPPK